MEERPFQPGERRSAAREMERKVKGYREIRKELVKSRKMMKQQQEKNPNEKTIQTSFYKSPVGTR